MVSQLLFTAFSNRADAVQLAREAGRQLQADGITSNLHLLDVDTTPDVDASTLVVSLGGDGTFLKSARLAHALGARVLAVNLGRVGFLLNVPSNEVVADGQDIGSLGAGQFVEVRKSPTPVRVVATRSFDLASRLHEGLREGHA